ncbi:hypothetical protein CROQUDRAFT_67552 [Cronartium quercuum f. sp. fusiforme G11]|uniref:Oligopeptide transporter n=1 Tax=Cronartium quercuum f. sp. fusiforme G11 TaxID=708437 RepID=A0A9P6T821_9BASI|nr:hypothetical protein CROQUDRAFT_67552 [Cronartium quercuum f. sp. fusiforme G11]
MSDGRVDSRRVEPDINKLKHDDLSELLDKRPVLKEAYVGALPTPLELHDQLASKNDFSIVERKPQKLNLISENYSDPFDDFAVVPEAKTDDDPKTIVISLRSVLVGIIMTVFGATISQLFIFKPVHLHIHVLFIQLACLLIGKFLASIPGPLWWNPCKLTVKETVFSAIMATSGAGCALSVEVIAAQDVFFERPLPAYVCILLIMSTQMIGFGWAGLFRRFLIYPKKTIFPSVLPSVALFHSLAEVSPSTRKQLSFFKKVFGAMSFYEAIPGYIAPALQAISPWCLTLPAVPAVTNLFGGSLVAEGLGFLSLSCDWVLGMPFWLALPTGSHSPLFVPLSAQIIDWAAVGTAIFLFTAAYRYNWFGGGNMPFISFNVLDSTGVQYNITRAIFENGTENAQEVEAMGLPSFATTYVLGKAGIAFSVSSAIVTAIMFNFNDLRAALSSSESDATLEDPHRSITKNYRDFPTYGFVILAAVAIFTAFFCSSHAESGLSAQALVTSFLISFILSFAAGFFYANVGISLHCHPVIQMLGGVLFPGNAIGNMWFTLFGSTSSGQCVGMLKDLKLGQYMNVPTLYVVIAQLIGTIIGGFVHFGVMTTIVNTQRDVLLLPNGNGVYTSIIPICLLIGFLAPVPFFLLHKWKPRAGFDRCNISLFASSLFHAVEGATSGRTTATLLAIVTQYTIRKYHFMWYKKYNYILSAALDGGTQLSMLLLTFLVQGGAGVKLDIPTYFLNPIGPRDYCYMPKGGHHKH